jgi:hypothetical protein
VLSAILGAIQQTTILARADWMVMGGSWVDRKGEHMVRSSTIYSSHRPREDGRTRETGLKRNIEDDPSSQESGGKALQFQYNIELGRRHMNKIRRGDRQKLPTLISLKQ